MNKYNVGIIFLTITVFTGSWGLAPGGGVAHAKSKLRSTTDENGGVVIESVETTPSAKSPLPPLTGSDGKPVFGADSTNFQKLKEEVKKLVAGRTDQKYRQYSSPLNYGMDAKTVTTLWKYGNIGGAAEKSGTGASSKVLRYDIGINLHFQNDRLVGWSRSK
ncbi:MAG: hypothetical protein ACYC69_02935 [Thermodesulfovibrionales bacterium]